MIYENIRSGNGGAILMKNDANKEIGRLTYTLIPAESRLIISYVMVHKEFEGRGMGKLLIQNAVSFARENRWHIYPHCSYARTVMLRMPEVQDILLAR